MNKNTPDFFNQDMAVAYDNRNSRLSKISDCYLFLLSLVLKDLPQKAKILCVGAGTGAEILFLSKIYPEWSFVALEPSKPMLDVCREKIKKEGLEDRCEFVNGYIHDMKNTEDFDGVLSVLVGHFVPLKDRPKFYKDMTDRLKKGGKLINLEISFDLESKEFPEMLKNWEAIQTLMGATPESITMLPKQLKEMLTVIPPEETKRLIRNSGIKTPISFFQGFMIHGVCGVK